MSKLPFELNPSILSVLINGDLPYEAEEKVWDELRQRFVGDSAEAREQRRVAYKEENLKPIYDEFEHMETDFVSSSTRVAVIKHKPSGRFFRFSYYYDSWGDGDDFDKTKDDLTEVFPAEKTIIVYEEKK